MQSLNQENLYQIQGGSLVYLTMVTVGTALITVVQQYRHAQQAVASGQMLQDKDANYPPQQE